MNADFDLYRPSEEHEALREAIRDLADEQIAPFAAEVDDQARGSGTRVCFLFIDSSCQQTWFVAVDVDWFACLASQVPDAVGCG